MMQKSARGQFGGGSLKRRCCPASLKRWTRWDTPWVSCKTPGRRGEIREKQHEEVYEYGPGRLVWVGRSGDDRDVVNRSLPSGSGGGTERVARGECGRPQLV